MAEELVDQLGDSGVLAQYQSHPEASVCLILGDLSLEAFDHSERSRIARDCEYFFVQRMRSLLTAGASGTPVTLAVGFDRAAQNKAIRVPASDNSPPSLDNSLDADEQVKRSASSRIPCLMMAFSVAGQRTEWDGGWDEETGVSLSLVDLRTREIVLTLSPATYPRSMRRGLFGI